MSLPIGPNMLPPVSSNVEPPSAKPKEPEYAALEGAIRELQKSYTNPIPELQFVELIKRVAQIVAPSLVVANQLKGTFRVSSLDLMSRMIVLDKDHKAGRTGTDGELDKVLKKLEGTPIGQEGLLRVVHAVSSTTFREALQPTPSIPFAEIQKAAVIFAAQPLWQELLKEEGFPK